MAEIYAGRGRPDHMTDEQFKRLMDGGAYLWEHMADARDMPPREALMPMGYPVGKYGPLSRRPVSQVAFADRWGEPWTVHGSTER